MVLGLCIPVGIVYQLDYQANGSTDHQNHVRNEEAFLSLLRIRSCSIQSTEK